MFTCTHVHMHACSHARMFTCTHVHIHACSHTHMFTYTHVHIHAYPHTHMLTYTHPHIHACSHTRMFAYTHPHMLACMHAYMHHDNRNSMHSTPVAANELFKLHAFIQQVSHMQTYPIAVACMHVCIWDNKEVCIFANMNDHFQLNIHDHMHAGMHAYMHQNMYKAIECTTHLLRLSGPYCFIKLSGFLWIVHVRHCSALLQTTVWVITMGCCATKLQWLQTSHILFEWLFHHTTCFLVNHDANVLTVLFDIVWSRVCMV
jgi:hypothetical protein